jgi:hypothetical protein
MRASDILQKYGAVHTKQFVSKELCDFLTHVLLRASDNALAYNFAEGDSQVPNAKVVVDHELIFETLLEKVWPDVEMLAEEELLPTYAYARLYSNGDELKVHTDRPSCEVSVTLQLGRSHHYAWPIYMGKNRYDMAEGDAVIYRGCDVEHWRNVCDGPEGYYSGQVFLHFVRKNGQFADHATDATVRQNPVSFSKYRTFTMDNK